MTDPADRRGLLRLVVRYAVVGAINTAVHFITTIALVESAAVEPVPASVVGFMLALLVAFFLNSHWTFGRTDRPVMRLYRFSMVSVLGLALNTLIMVAVVDWLGAHYIFGLVLVALVIPPTNFLLNRHLRAARGEPGASGRPVRRGARRGPPGRRGCAC